MDNSSLSPGLCQERFWESVPSEKNVISSC